MILSVHLLLFFCCGLSLAQLQHQKQTELDCSESCVSQAEFAAMKERLKVVENLLKNIENQTADTRKQASIPVIFSAGIGGDVAIGPFNTDKTLIYNSVTTNIGSGYNQHTGIFTAPVPGVYYFTFFYHAGGQHRVLLRLYKNNQVIAATHDHATESDGADNGGNTVFVQLQRGDQVYVRLMANKHVWGDIHTTTFSGFLVTPM